MRKTESHKMADATESCSIEQNVDNTITLSNEEVSKYLTINNKGKFKWIGPFESLKMFMSELTKSEKIWSAPGGYCKLLELNDVAVRWYADSHSLTINGKLSDDFRSQLRNIASQERPEAEIVNISEPEISSCPCFGIVDANLEGIKLDMTILESRLMSALVNNETGSEINLLKLKIKELERVMRSQDEVIYHLNEENASFKLRLLALEKTVLSMTQDNMIKDGKSTNTIDKTVLSMSQDNSNKDGKSTNAINIEENLTSPDFTQRINLNENILMAECGNENSSSVNNKQPTDQMINTTDTAPPVLKNIAETLAESQKKLVKIIKKTNETDRSDNSIEISEAINHNLNNHKTDNALGQKHLVPCPFLSRRGHCLKGSKCDFSHQLITQQPDSPYPQQNTSTSIPRRILYPPQRFQPTTNYPNHHSYTNFPSFYPPPLMETHTIPSFQPVPPPNYPVFYPFHNLPNFYPPPLMEIPTRPPLMEISKRPSPPSIPPFLR